MIVLVDTAAVHGPAPSGSLVVNVNTTEPLVMLGVYVEVSEFTSENVPLGALHVEVVALPPILPANVIVVPEHIVKAPPAFAVAAGFTVIVLVDVTAGQTPGAFVVNVKVTVPVKFAAGVYVTVAGVAVCAMLLNVPPPDVIDHAPVVAPPPTLAPLNVSADGVAD